MERAGRLLGILKLPKDLAEPEALARRAWPAAVGKRIAMQARPVRLVRTKLIVECDDVLWQRNLNTLAPQILRNLQQLLGEGLVTDLDFRPATLPRRQPQLAAAAHSDSQDEADRIQDPVFRLLYKQSRKKALA
jgi:predicted nucleic acid-binding Zn ribbon protein